MPRRARRDDVKSAAIEDVAQLNASPANDDSPDNLAQLTPASPAQDQQADPPDSDSQPESTAPKSRSRRSRATRVKAGATSVEVPSAASAVEEPSTDLSTSPAAETGKPRRRGSRRAVPTAPSQDQVASGATEVAGISVEAEPSPTQSPELAAPPRRRQVGGRRSAAQITAATELTPTDLAASSTDSDAETSAADAGARSSRRNRRGGSRRRRAQAVSTEEATNEAEAGAADLLESVELKTPTLAEGEEAPVPDAEEGPRSRRSRRGGRRRSKGEGAVDQETGEAISVAAVEPLDELALPAPHLVERYIAPSLVPTATNLGLARIDLGIEASLDTAIPAFNINGKSYSTHLCFVNADPAESSSDDIDIVGRQIGRAALAGVHLHTAVAYLPLKNAYGERSMDAMDDVLRAVLDADPEGFIALRVQCAPTNFWVRTHPNQMVRYQDGSEGDVTIASAEFWTDCVDALNAMLQHLAQPDSPGHGRVFALHLDKGEWFYEPGAGFDYSEPNRVSYRNWLHEQYQASYALRASWLDNRVLFETVEIPAWQDNKDKRDDSVLYDRRGDRQYVDYSSYSSSVVGSVICGLASAVKELTGGKILVFVPYGYIFEFATRNDSGHNALGQVLNCDSVDVLTGPNSYSSRAAGGVGGFAAPVDSVLLHNKIWLVEDDTKTFLAPDNTPDTYNPKIPTPQETVMVHRRNFFAALAHGCGLTWMDLWGQGWLDDDTIWEEFHDMLAAAQRFQAAADPYSPAPEVAVIVDEASYAWVRNDSGGHQLQTGAIVKARDLLLRSGASVGFYLQSDVARLPDSVKIVIFLNALRVSAEERRSIRERLQRPGMTLAWLYAPGLFDEKGIAAAEITEIVGMALKPQQWSSRIGTIFTDERHIIIERLHGGKRMGTADIVNPSFTVADPQAAVLGEYAQSGNPSIVAKSVEGGWKSIFVGEPHLTGELIRGMFRYSGVHIYDVQDDIVYTRKDGTLLIHAPYSGQRVIYLPKPSACYSLFEGRLLTQNSSSVRVFMRGRSTHLLLWGDLETIGARAGKSVDQLLESVNTRGDRERGQGQDRQADQEWRANRSEGYSEEDILQQKQLRPEQASEDRRFQSDSDQYFEQSESSSERLGQVLQAVVEEAYVESVGVVDNAEAALLDAKREAARITEELLSDITIDVDVTLIGADMDSLSDEAGDRQETGSNSGEPGGRRRSSSRRRKWRRKQTSGDQSETTAPVSVDDMIGDLVAKHHKTSDDSANGPDQPIVS